ncbi:hypothetical protein ACOMHN_051495 [Nucella lapillus]
MGNWTCTTACAASDRCYNDQLGRHLTPEEVKDVQETWSILSKDLAGLGLTVFLNKDLAGLGLTVFLK